MKSQLVPFIPFSEFKEERHTMTIREIIMKHFFHWPLFVLSLVFFLACAYWYIRLSHPVYEVQAKLLFKDDQKGTDQESNLQELNFFDNNKLVENEMEILSSRMLMQEVVYDLQLWVDYKQNVGLTNKDLYMESPFQLVLFDGTGHITPTQFSVTIKGPSQFILKQGEKETEFNGSSTLQNKSGKWKFKVSKDLERHVGSTIIISVKDPADATEEFLDNLKISVIDKVATVVELSLEETVPERGRDILNRLISLYDLAAVRDKNRVTQSTLAFIDERLAAVAKELSEVESSVAGFKSINGINEIAAQSEFYLENFQANDARLNEAEIQLQIIEGIEKYVNNPSTTRAPATVGISDPGLISLTQQLITLELQRERMLASIPESNPVFEPVNQQINSTRQAIKDNIQGIKSSLKGTLNQLQSYNRRVESSIKNLPGQEKTYIDIRRQQTIKEDLYTYLLRNREEAALSYGSTLSDSRTIDTAFYGEPVSPKIPLTYGLALLFSLAFPVGLIYLRDSLNNKIINAEEIDEGASIPLLGELMSQNGSNQIVMNDRNNRVIAEQFRMLRTNLQDVVVDDEDRRVIQITSGMSGEGKSFITCNLGVAFAKAGRKTIIVELDMRRPSLSKYFKLEGAAGLSDFLIGNVPMQDIVQQVPAHENLYVINSGFIPPNPLELLDTNYLHQLIETLRLEFDKILIDSPPVRLVAEGMIMARYSDINLYVIRHSYTPKSHLKYMQQLSKSNKLKNLHVIFNGVPLGGRYSYTQDFDFSYYSSAADQKRVSMSSKLQRVIERL